MLDNLEFSNFHIYIICCLGVTWLFDGYEVSIMGLYAKDI